MTAKWAKGIIGSDSRVVRKIIPKDGERDAVFNAEIPLVDR